MTVQGSTRGLAAIPKRIAAAGMVAALALLLAACMLMPGKFASSLDLRKDGRFSFAYKGEIHFVSPSELDEKKADKPADKEAEAAQMEAMMGGGANLSDPRAAEEFARKLARQHGWRSVKSMGKGRFDVDYAISGTLTHDFTFPVIEGFAQATPFVQVIRRNDGTVRVSAPAFSSGPDGSPLRSLARMGAMDQSGKDEAGKDKEPKKGPKLPVLDGTFALTTDGAILANNTEDGPQADANGSALNWKVNDSTDSAPTALIGLAK
jgi:hypothetical protein